MDFSWHEPKQERSRKRFAAILASAAELFATLGFEGVTTNHIADHAGIPIGSLYQFFPNKEAILAALVQRYLQELHTVFPLLSDTHLPFEQVVQQMIENLAHFQQAHAAFTAIFTALESHGHEAITHPIHNTILGRVMQLLALYFPRMSAAQCERCATTGIGIVKGLIILARPPYVLPPDQVVIEVKTALLAYTEAFLHREGLQNRP